MIETFLYTRSIEILMSISGGAFLCWLGYRLFHLGLSDKSDLKLEYGKFKFQIYCAAPGIFFSLFGAAIIFVSVWRQATIEDKQYFKDGVNRHINITKGVGPDINLESQIEDMFSRALSLHKNNNFQESKKIYIRILKSLPRLGEITNNLADIYLRENDRQHAGIYATYAITVFPKIDTYQRTMNNIHQKSSASPGNK